MTELDEILKRLEVLETQVAALTEAHSQSRRAADLFALVDRDMADLNTAFGTQRKLMQALREEQAASGTVWPNTARRWTGSSPRCGSSTTPSSSRAATSPSRTGCWPGSIPAADRSVPADGEQAP